MVATVAGPSHRRATLTLLARVCSPCQTVIGASTAFSSVPSSEMPRLLGTLLFAGVAAAALQQPQYVCLNKMYGCTTQDGCWNENNPALRAGRGRRGHLRGRSHQRRRHHDGAHLRDHRAARVQPHDGR